MSELVPIYGHIDTWGFEIVVAILILGLSALASGLERAAEIVRRRTGAIFDDDSQVSGDTWREEFQDPRIADVWRRWGDGELTTEEAERRVGSLIDRPRRELRETLEESDGIGPETTATLAREYRSIGEVRAAGADELEEIEGVGPATRKRIRSAIGDGDQQIREGGIES